MGGVRPSVKANRVTYARAGLSEWYLNGPLGLEQGFTIPKAPSGHPAGPLTLSMTLTGDAHAVLAAGGASLTLSHTGGSSLRYGGLLATDAREHLLHSWLQLKAGRLLIRIDARGARYPLWIDPLIQQGHKLDGEEAKGQAEFGWSVALSSDGNTALIGGPGENGYTGAAWVFTRSGSTWTQQGPKLVGGSEEAGGGEFGYSVALSADGNTALIGGPDNQPRESTSGAVWVFTRSGSTWTQQGPKLVGGSEEITQQAFGFSVALSADGDTALVGSQAAVWVFTRSGSTWTQQGPILVPNGEPSALFGDSVALSGDGNTALISGPDSPISEAPDSPPGGAVWVFTRSGSTWTQQGPRFTGTEVSGPCGSQFGDSVALSSDGNTALIGGSVDGSGCSGVGSAWVFTRSGSKWTQQGPRLINPSGEPGEGYFGFGDSVALSSDGNTALIGGETDNGNRGAAWVFTRSGETWTQQGSKLTGGGEAGGGAFGDSVALSGDASTALIGGIDDDTFLGSAWVFSSSTSNNPPAAVTSAASSVALTSATLNATVNPEGTTVSDCHFEYGTSPSYGSSAPCASLPGSGISPVPVSASVTELSPHTLYYFRIVATNSGGTSRGAERMFTPGSPEQEVPEVGRCLTLSPSATGRYKTAACTTKSTGEDTGKYEWHPWPAAKDHFSIKKGATVLSTHGKATIKCLNNTFAGEYTGSQTAVVSMIWGGCEGSSGLGGKCQSEGAEAGEVRSNALEGQLGFIKSGTKPSVGWDLKPVSQAYLATFKCGKLAVSLAGSVIAQSTPVDKMATTFKIGFKGGTEGVQSPERFEKGLKDTLTLIANGEEEEELGLRMTDSIVNEESVEIKAIV